MPIRTITLDTLLDRIGRTIDLLQMDVQGLEVEVLEGGVHSLKTARVQTYLIGTHSLKIHRECSAMLEEFLSRLASCFTVLEDHPPEKLFVVQANSSSTPEAALIYKRSETRHDSHQGLSSPIRPVQPSLSS